MKLYDYINITVKEHDPFKTEIDIMRYCTNYVISKFPLILKEYYEEFDLEFQFTPSTHKQYAGYFDSWKQKKSGMLLQAKR